MQGIGGYGPHISNSNSGYNSLGANAISADIHGGYGTHASSSNSSYGHGTTLPTAQNDDEQSVTV